MMINRLGNKKRFINKPASVWLLKSGAAVTKCSPDSGTNLPTNTLLIKNNNTIPVSANLTFECIFTIIVLNTYLWNCNITLTACYCY